MGDKSKRILLAGSAVAALALGGAALSGAQAGDDERRAIPERDGDADAQATGRAADAARAAALRAVGGGTVTEVEHADDGAPGYEVEIDKPDGTSVEVFVAPDGTAGAVSVDD